MSRRDQLDRLWEHLAWADRTLFGALPVDPGRAAVPARAAEAVREFAHLVGAEEAWLARLERRSPRAAVWPDVGGGELERLMEATHAAYRRFMADLDDAALDATIAYSTSGGGRFETRRGDILLHVALHGQYHRGKVNVLLRQAGLPPAPVDMIAFVRGTPAARSVPPAVRGAGEDQS